MSIFYGIRQKHFFAKKSLLFCFADPAIEWRILGQEQDGSILASWVSKPVHTPKSFIGIYNPSEKSFDILHTFPQRENVIQASINRSRTLLVFVIKDAGT